MMQRVIQLQWNLYPIYVLYSLYYESVKCKSVCTLCASVDLQKGVCVCVYVWCELGWE